MKINLFPQHRKFTPFSLLQIGYVGMQFVSKATGNLNQVRGVVLRRGPQPSQDGQLSDTATGAGSAPREKARLQGARGADPLSSAAASARTRLLLAHRWTGPRALSPPRNRGP